MFKREQANKLVLLLLKQPFTLIEYSLKLIIMKKVALFIGGILHMVIIRKDSNMQDRVARIHDLKGNPIAVLRELANKPGVFMDTVEQTEYKFNVSESALISV